MTRRSLALAGALWLAAVPAARAADAAAGYPAKPVRMIVGYAPGGGTDIMGRIIAQELTKTLAQQFVVENRPGAAQNLGAELVARSPADGYTLFMSSAAHGINISLYPKLSYHPVRDFAPVALFAISPNLLLVHPSLPARTVKEFIALAKKNPGTALVLRFVPVLLGAGAWAAESIEGADRSRKRRAGLRAPARRTASDSARASARVRNGYGSRGRFVLMADDPVG